ncbi:hypothetical protein [Microcoleus sp. B4-C1]|uniref:hypothetical protein n=1 Tax=Microcoleus sp. B4-C1 TaxID=2818660 RepID=UPI002FCEECE0
MTEIAIFSGIRLSAFFYEPLSRRTTGGTPVPQSKRREEEELTGAAIIARYAQSWFLSKKATARIS